VNTPQEPQPDPAAPEPSGEPISLSKPADPAGEPTQVEEPFDPYRFGPPDHPVPPEYAPPGYVEQGYTPPPSTPPPTTPAPGPTTPAGSGYPGYQPYPTVPPPGGRFGYPPPPMHPYQQPKTGNGKATAGLVLGIVAIVFFWLSILDVIPVVLGLIFGSLGLSESRRTGSGRGQAIAGIVCAAIGAVLAIVFTVVIWTRISPCRDFPSGSAEFNSCVRRHL
jgi:hypothetical protein